jgi:hypothetical protein
MGATISSDAGARARRGVRLLFLTLVLGLGGVAASFAQDPPVFDPLRPMSEAPVARGEGGRAERTATFLLGAAAGLGLHEGGHLLFDGLFGVEPVLKKVDFGGIPFFAITHAQTSPRKEFAISSAGFWMQHLSSEIVLTRHPGLRAEAAPGLKGLLAFDVLASVAYGGAALAKAGPAERDTRAMAAALRVDEAWVGVLVLLPAGLDAWRYFHPDSRWAAWLSRGVKVGGVLLVIK